MINSIKENLQTIETSFKNLNNKTENIKENIILFPHMPKVSLKLAIFIMILNFILPGVGTIVLGCFLPEGFTNEKGVVCWSLTFVGIIQMILAVCLVGWIWSIAFGVLLVQISYKKR